jgi:hypothetical protein
MRQFHSEYLIHTNNIIKVSVIIIVIIHQSSPVSYTSDTLTASK